MTYLAHICARAAPQAGHDSCWEAPELRPGAWGRAPLPALPGGCEPRAHELQPAGPSPLHPAHPICYFLGQSQFFGAH